MLRLYITHAPLKLGEIIVLDASQTHYAIKVMRIKGKEKMLVFNSKEGEWLAEMVNIDNKNCNILLTEQVKKQEYTSPLTLVFAPIKAHSASFIVEKATELGVTQIIPVLTQRSVVKTVNLSKLEIAAKEAAEQCERLDIPKIHDITTIEELIAHRHFKGNLILCAERSDGQKLSDIAFSMPKNDNAIMVGSEGGFSPKELSQLQHVEWCKSISLGSRILRAETAIIAALGIYQEVVGI